MKRKLFIKGTEIKVEVITLTTAEEQRILTEQDMNYEGKIFRRNAPELPISYRSGTFVFSKNAHGFLTVNSL